MNQYGKKINLRIIDKLKKSKKIVCSRLNKIFFLCKFCTIVIPYRDGNGKQQCELQ